ncbi:retrotransposable element Tf2 [Tanacetum coccineum]|uniref:Retrotransposable element Tf2 n=1 Tax=Tanacetum coccineum TaxID=301880 RepID=A0ABQ5G4N9_9ASTR
MDYHTHDLETRNCVFTPKVRRYYLNGKSGDTLPIIRAQIFLYYYLNKSVHSLPNCQDYSDSKIARIFQQEIVQLHGTPSAIVSDKDPRFTFRILETHTRQEGYTNKLSRPLKLSAKLSCFLESIAYEWRQTFWYYRQDLFHQTIRNSRSHREISYRLAYLLSYHTFMMYFTCFVQKSQVSFLSRCLLSTRSDS